MLTITIQSDQTLIHYNDIRITYINDVLFLSKQMDGVNLLREVFSLNYFPYYIANRSASPRYDLTRLQNYLEKFPAWRKEIFKLVLKLGICNFVTNNDYYYVEKDLLELFPEYRKNILKRVLNPVYLKRVLTSNHQLLFYAKNYPENQNLLFNYCYGSEQFPKYIGYYLPHLEDVVKFYPQRADFLFYSLIRRGLLTPKYLGGKLNRTFNEHDIGECQKIFSSNKARTLLRWFVLCHAASFILSFANRNQAFEALYFLLNEKFMYAEMEIMNQNSKQLQAILETERKNLAKSMAVIYTLAQAQRDENCELSCLSNKLLIDIAAKANSGQTHPQKHHFDTALTFFSRPILIKNPSLLFSKCVMK